VGAEGRLLSHARSCSKRVHRDVDGERSTMRAWLCVALAIVLSVAATPKVHAVLPRGSFDGHMTLAETDQFFGALHSRFPKWATASVAIGKSYERRPIHATCVGACSDANAAQVLITAMHHAREVRRCATVVLGE